MLTSLYLTVVQGLLVFNGCFHFMADRYSSSILSCHLWLQVLQD